MEDETSSHLNNKIWELVNKPKDYKLINCKR